MKDIIKIGNDEVTMVANGATSYFFSQIFNQDFFAESEKINEETGSLSVDLFQKLGFIMAEQGTGKAFREMLKLNEEQYVEWLSKYEAMDLVNAAADIATLYTKNTKTKSTPKK